MLTKPRWLLHLEGACIFALTLVLYGAGHFHWWLFALLLLTPDLFMLGYAANPKIGLRPPTTLYTLRLYRFCCWASRLWLHCPRSSLTP